MGAPRTTIKVLDWLKDKENLRIHVADAVKDTGLDKKQVLSALGNLRNRAGYNIESVISGEVYMYRSGPKKEEVDTIGSDKRLFEELGTAKDGRLIIQDARGTLFEAKEL